MTYILCNVIQMAWTDVADSNTIEGTIAALKANGFNAIVVENGAEAKEAVLEIIPKGAEVMKMTSVTLDTIGVTSALEESGEYESLGKKIRSIEDPVERDRLRKALLSPQYAVGSVHAITSDGKVVIASASGSQLPAYTYGAEKVIWVVGAQKLVKNLDDAIKRIYEHSLKLESERVQKAYGMPRSSVNKILVYEREKPGRVNVIIVKEALGF